MRQRFEVQWCVFVSGCELDGSQVLLAQTQDCKDVDRGHCMVMGADES